MKLSLHLQTILNLFPVIFFYKNMDFILKIVSRAYIYMIQSTVHIVWKFGLTSGMQKNDLGF